VLQFYYNTAINIAPKDVLLGRGGDTNVHLGNHDFRELITEYLPHYRGKNRLKHEIALKIYSTLNSRGARFLRKNESSKLWIIVNQEDAVKKIKQALRDRKRDDVVQIADLDSFELFPEGLLYVETPHLH